MAWELEVDLAPASAGFAAREGEIFSRNFAKIFFNISGEDVSVCEYAGFATMDMIPLGEPRPPLDFEHNRNTHGYIIK